MRRSQRKGKFCVDDDKLFDNTTELNTNVIIDDNPSYDVTKANTVDRSYDTINPGGSDVPITTNPSYNVHTKPYSKTSEDEYNYVQPNELTQHSGLDHHGYIKMNSNSPCGEDKPIITATNSATTKQQDYDYAHSDNLFTGNAKDSYSQVHANVDQLSYVKPVDEVEYGVINQPKN